MMLGVLPALGSLTSERFADFPCLAGLSLESIVILPLNDRPIEERVRHLLTSSSKTALRSQHYRQVRRRYIAERSVSTKKPFIEMSGIENSSYTMDDPNDI